MSVMLESSVERKMHAGLSSESAHWILPSYPTSESPALPSYEDALPFRVNHEGVKNYLRNRGSLNIGDWAVEGRRPSTAKSTAPIEQESFVAQPKVLGPDALRNYTKSRSTTPNLIYGTLQPADPHHQLRVRREGLPNYERNHNSQMKGLLENYGKSPLPAQPVPHTQGQIATNLFYTHQEGQMGPILNNYGRAVASPRPAPHVKGSAAELNLQRGQGDSRLLAHGLDRRSPTPEPHVKGMQAQLNYDMGQGHHVDQLLHHYGRMEQSARSGPKVKYDGVNNLIKGQGDAMRKTLSQCPPSSRQHVERPQSAPRWS